MKRLILMRHAKSSWADEGQRDHERPLNERGRREAPIIGGWLAANGHAPDIAFVSSAVRTRETWAALGSDFAGIDFEVRPDLYDAATDRYLAALRTARGVDCVLMLGHMPTIGAFARQMLGAPPEDPEFARYPTAATAVLALDIDRWSAAAHSVGELVAFATPKALG